MKDLISFLPLLFLALVAVFVLMPVGITTGIRNLGNTMSSYASMAVGPVSPILFIPLGLAFIAFLIWRRSRWRQ